MLRVQKKTTENSFLLYDLPRAKSPKKTVSVSGTLYRKKLVATSQS